MRLLTRDDSGKISLTEFPNDKTPFYAILSHTWGEEEVTFKDVTNGTAETKLGYEKLKFCGEQAARDGWQYFWVDTCCIDKSSSAELQRSINSMFRWYRDAVVCYVYLADVSISTSEDSSVMTTWEEAFRRSRWFRRGWTLQELIAPKSVEFFSREGMHLGNKNTLEQSICEITKIPVKALQGCEDLSIFTVDERMAWMQGRETTEEEDMAYSLLGILNVYMPLIYSEGKDNALRRLKEEVNKKTPPKPSVFIPFLRDPDFVDRGNILDEINLRCSEPAGRVALVGLGGVGKSQLAIEAAYRIAETKREIWLFWVYAGTRARVEEGFKTIADTVELPGRDQPKANVPQLVHNWLSNKSSSEWIMVLDSADTFEVFYGVSEGGNDRPLVSYLPQSQNGSIVVTTRNKDLAFRLTGNRKRMIEVGPMTSREALTLLEKKLELTGDVGAAMDLVKALDYVPLAISQAAAYIQAREPRSSVQRYLEEFRVSERKKTRLLEHDAGDLRRDGGASNAILVTWQISFEDIRNKRPSAADLLSVMSFFDRQGIPESVLRSYRQKAERIRLLIEDDEHDSGVSTDSDTTDDKEGTDCSFEDDVAMLRDYCLISANEEGDEFEMHGLVQLAMRKWLAIDGQQETFKNLYIAIMADSLPMGKYKDWHEDWPIWQRVFAHVQVALDYEPADEIVRHWAVLLQKASLYAAMQGKYNVAERIARKVRRVCIKKLRDDDITTLSNNNLLASVLGILGRLEDAERLQTQVVVTERDKYGVGHPATLVGLGSLAMIYQRQGRLDEAERLQTQVVVTGRDKYEVGHPATLVGLGGLAMTYQRQGRLEEAEELQTQVVESSKNTLGVDHLGTVISIDNLASIYANQGRWDEAERLQLQVLETRRLRLSPDPYDMLSAMGNLARTYSHQGRLDEAERLEVQLMEKSKNKFGKDHPHTLRSMHDLAYTWNAKGRTKDALALMKSCLEARQSILGMQHPSTLASLAAVESWGSTDQVE